MGFEALVNIASLVIVAVCKLYIFWILLSKTWVWTHVGRGLLLMFLGFGLFYSYAALNSLCSCVPDIVPYLRWFIVGDCLYLIIALKTYPWPRDPERVNWLGVLGVRNGER